MCTVFYVRNEKYIDIRCLKTDIIDDVGYTGNNDVTGKMVTSFRIK
ncbi:hypothetical protein GCM10007140_37710 [Priestia taiwanensis]|uniref:Uncharacterized protein n=1 Tax=Priestia taiwanensis TaxID=1347902 RepID=A0A917ERX5_9BACI|nr:hypothetical protein GCM10007140_37710 [Priestia taiwanensis]